MSGNRSLTMRLVFAVTSMLVFFSTHLVQAVTIDNLPEEGDPYSSVWFFGAGVNYIGQSFISPVGGSVQELSLTFGLSDMFPDNDTDVSFVVSLTETIHGTGNDITPSTVLDDTEELSLLTGSACASGFSCTVNFSDLWLTDGATYAWILEAAGGSDWGSVDRLDGYEGGHYFFRQNGADAWGDEPGGGDLVFSIDITPASVLVAPVPVPTALPLMLSGLVGMGLLGHRARR